MPKSLKSMIFDSFSTHMNDTLYLHCLNLFPKFGPKRLLVLVNFFNSCKEAFSAPVSELCAAGISRDIAEQFSMFRASIVPDKEQEILSSLGIDLLGLGHINYPQLLAEIPDPPVLLYYRGSLPAPDAIMLAAIGTRKITTYGRSIVPQIISPLVSAGIIVVSGMAYGVDALVHTQAVEKRRPTIAVLGSGLDEKSVYPKEHALLADEIISAGGCLLSEYAPGTPGFKQNFIARNRIIAGLAIGTLVIECSLKSGSLITAHYALEQNRRVYAVPGHIYAHESQGPNNLLKMGAQPVTEAADILQDLNIAPELEPEATLAATTPTEAILIGILTRSPLSSDELVKLTGLETSAVSTALSFLEMRGTIKNVGAQQYIRIR